MRLLHAFMIHCDSAVSADADAASEQQTGTWPENPPFPVPTMRSMASPDQDREIQRHGHGQPPQAAATGSAAAQYSLRYAQELAHGILSFSCVLRLLRELGIVNFLINRARSRSSSSWVPLPDQRTVIQHKDLVGILDGGGALGHHEHTVTFRIVGADGLAQARVGGIVQRRGAVVQNENFRIAHQRAGDGQALPLAAGEVACRPARPRRSARPRGSSTNSAACERLERDLRARLVRCVLLAPAQILRGWCPANRTAFCGTTPILLRSCPAGSVAYIDAVDKDTVHPSRRRSGG